MDVDFDHPNLKYLGEALFLLGIAYKLLRWAFRTKAEIDGVDPDGFWSVLGRNLNPINSLSDLVDNVNQLLGRGQYSRSNVTVIVNSQLPVSSPVGAKATTVTSKTEPPPPSLLEILTPEQRKLVLEQLAKDEDHHS